MLAGLRRVEELGLCGAVFSSYQRKLQVYFHQQNKMLGKVNKILKFLTRNILRVKIVMRGELMKSYSSREVISMLINDGWYEVNQVGDHKQFKHPTKKERVTVTHPVKTMPVWNLKSIEKQSDVKFP